VLESKDAQVLLPELLPFVCQTDAFFEHAIGTSAGSLSPRTNWTSLANFEFALPPVEEQTKIIELLQASQSVCSAQLEAIDNLRNLRQSTIDRLSLQSNQSCIRLEIVTSMQNRFGPRCF
jgi:type I restriction enzyme S subunit